MGSIIGKSTVGTGGGSNPAPMSGSSSRIRKTTEFTATETVATKKSSSTKQEWHEYYELDDQDDGHKKRSADLESQENILPPGQRK